MNKFPPSPRNQKHKAPSSHPSTRKDSKEKDLSELITKKGGMRSSTGQEYIFRGGEEETRNRIYNSSKKKDIHEKKVFCWERGRRKGDR
jgi:hypothetical protein